MIIGSDACRPIVDRYRMPCVVAGFEPIDILSALVSLLRQIERGEAVLENAYPAAVAPRGNAVAQRLIDEVFDVADTPWRALGVIPGSGLELRSTFRRFDAVERFNVEMDEDRDHPACRCGEVIQGKVTPEECALFGTTCTPLMPYGPCMVSCEGTGNAWFKYSRPAKRPKPIEIGT